jgi:heptose I phosphotransferase
VADYFVREDFAAAVNLEVHGAHALLCWAADVVARTSPQDVYRRREGRTTLRLDAMDRGFFLKLHTGVGWGEIVKNLLQARLPVLGAANEYRAALALARSGVDTLSVAAYAATGGNPATRQSLLVCDELAGTVSLEKFCADWSRAPPSPPVRQRLITRIADSARRMHAAGINHRDFYLCHFHLDTDTLAARAPRLYLIDLHRAQVRRRTPLRWRIKDLAGLYFSAMDCGLTRRDLLRFLRHYSGAGLRHALVEEAAMWRRVSARARRLYINQHGATPPTIHGVGPRTHDR